jgi:hypothetical protein
MDIYNSCNNDKQMSVSSLDKCFKNGHKLAVITYDNNLKGYHVPSEWDFIDIRGEYILLFPNSFTADLFKKACDIYNVGYDWIKKPTLQGDIIHYLFFGTCLFEIADTVFLYENPELDESIKNAWKLLRANKLSKTEFREFIKYGAFHKKQQTLKTIFNYIIEICTYLHTNIKQNPKLFKMNSTVVRNIELGTLFHGSCMHRERTPPPPPKKPSPKKRTLRNLTIQLLTLNRLYKN